MSEPGASASVCLDASVVVLWLNSSEYPSAKNRIESALESGSRLIAPPLMRYEVTNAIYQSLKAGVLEVPTVIALLDALLSLPIDIVDEPPIHESALMLAYRFRSGATYDSHYVALSQELDAELWTADRRLFNTLSPHLDFITVLDRA